MIEVLTCADSSAGSTIQHLALFELALTATTRELSSFWLMLPIPTRLEIKLMKVFDTLLRFAEILPQLKTGDLIENGPHANQYQ